MRVTLADAGEGGEPTVSRTEASPSYPPTPSLPGQALVPWRYVEVLNDARTPLAGFFSILLHPAAEVFSLQTSHHPHIVVRDFAQRIHEVETFALD